MGYTVSIYRGLATCLIIVLLKACIQKQDALIISANNSEPFVQVRCILVPGLILPKNGREILNIGSLGLMGQQIV